MESVLLSLLGGGLGVSISFFSLELLKEFAAGFTTLATEITINASVLLFSMIASIAAGLLSGCIAIASRGNINKSLKEGGSKVTASSSGKNTRTYLLLVQLALSFVILCSSILVAYSLFKLTSEELGLNTDKVLTMTLNLNFTNYRSPEDIRQFQERLLTDVKALPWVDSASTSGGFPLSGNLAAPVPFELEHFALNYGDIRPRAEANTVSPDYYQLFNIPLLSGRFFNKHDDERNMPVVIINQAMKNRYFANKKAIGSRLSVDEGKSWLTIVGVVGNTKSADIRQEPLVAFYTPFSQNPASGIELLVRAKGEPKSLIPLLEKTISSLDPQQAISDVATMKEVKEKATASSKLIAVLIFIFSIVAFAITLSGVYGVIAFNVKQRTKEIGIRMSIGANDGDIFNLLLKDGVLNTFLGVSLGIGGMLYIDPLLTPLLFKVDSAFFSILLGSTILIICVVSVAMALPARKAMKINPYEALRDD